MFERRQNVDIEHVNSSAVNFSTRGNGRILRSSLIKWSWTIACIGVCLWQIYQICDVYFSYETSIKIGYASKSIISPPGITLCFLESLLWQRNKLEPIYPLLFKDLDSSNKSDPNHYFRMITNMNNIIKSETRNLSFNDYDNLMGISPLIRKAHCGLKVNLHSMPCTNVTNWKVTRTSHTICFNMFNQSLENHGKPLNSIFERSNKNLNVSYVERSKPDYVKIKFTFKRKENFAIVESSVVHLYIHSNHQRFQATWGLTVINPDQRKFFTYSKIKTIFLPPPYVTKCKNYTDDEFETQSDCIVDCIGREMMRKCKTWPFESPTYLNSSAKFPENVEKEECAKDLITKIEKMCKNIICSFQDCVQENFIVINVGSSTLIPIENIITFNFYMPLAPDVETIFIVIPKLELVEFLVYIGSIISLWFGFSFISFNVHIERLSTRVNDNLKIASRQANKIYTNICVKCKFTVRNIYSKFRPKNKNQVRHQGSV